MVKGSIGAGVEQEQGESAGTQPYLLLSSLSSAVSALRGPACPCWPPGRPWPPVTASGLRRLSVRCMRVVSEAASMSRRAHVDVAVACIDQCTLKPQVPSGSTWEITCDALHTKDTALLGS